MWSSHNDAVVTVPVTARVGVHFTDFPPVFLIVFSPSIPSALAVTNLSSFCEKIWSLQECYKKSFTVKLWGIALPTRHKRRESHSSHHVA